MIPVVPPKLKEKTKKELHEQADKYKAAIEAQVEMIKTKGFEIGKIALIAGGIAFAGYLFVDFFTGKNKKRKIKGAVLRMENNKLPNSKTTKDSWIVSSIKSYIIAFLIGIAREKIAEALADLNKDDAKSDIQ